MGCAVACRITYHDLHDRDDDDKDDDVNDDLFYFYSILYCSILFIFCFYSIIFSSILLCVHAPYCEREGGKGREGREGGKETETETERANPPLLHDDSPCPYISGLF